MVRPRKAEMKAHPGLKLKKFSKSQERVNK